MLRVGFQTSAYTVEEEDGYLEVCVELTAWKDDLSFVSIIPVHTGSAEGINTLNFNGVCPSVCHRNDVLPICGPISGCIVSATVTLPHFALLLPRSMNTNEQLLAGSGVLCTNFLRG